jgi:ketosteroid isomerase-like protein
MNAQTEALERFFAAVNRHDIEAAVRDFDPQIVRVEPPGFPSSGTYRGAAAVRAQLAAGRASWAEGRCDPEQMLVRGDKVVVYVHVHVRLKASGEWVDARFADGFIFRDGKISHYQSFATRPEALRWAGIDEPA